MRIGRKMRVERKKGFGLTLPIFFILFLEIQKATKTELYYLQTNTCYKLFISLKDNYYTFLEFG